MKLSELGPSLDPRKPLRLAGNPAVRPARDRGTGRVVPRSLRVSVADLVDGDDLDLSGIDRGIAVLAEQTRLVGRPHSYWQQVAVRLHRRPRLAELRTRAARTIEMFTGASTGTLLSLWQQESEQLNAQLHAELARRWQHLRSTRAGFSRINTAHADPFAAAAATALDVMRTEIAQIKLLWAQLESFDELERCFNSSTVIALSPAAATSIKARSVLPGGRLERAFETRDGWGSGVAWLPDRRLFLAWSATDYELQLFEIDAADMSAWIHSLLTDTPRTLSWRTTLIPDMGRLAGSEPWTELAAVLTQLIPWGQAPVPAVGSGERLGRMAPVNRSRADDPTTRLVISAAEGRSGIDPIELAGGTVPTVEWIRARWRRSWSAEQGRYVQAWTDACLKSARRPPNESVLVTVLP